LQIRDDDDGEPTIYPHPSGAVPMNARSRRSGGRRGAQTREKIEKAAAKLFQTHGYHGTSLQRVADASGVHVQTIYLAYGTKVGLLGAVASRQVAEGEDPAVPPQERKWVRALVAEPDPREKFRLYVRHIRNVAEAWGPIRDVMRAAADEPEVADKLAAMEHGRYQGPQNLWPAIEERGQFRDGITAQQAADLTYAIASPDTFRQLRERGWTWEQAEEGITEVLARTLLQTTGPGRRHRNVQ
jgi:AcrR family transcriptional regulator